jgi:hypothetical protein
MSSKDLVSCGLNLEFKWLRLGKDKGGLLGKVQGKEMFLTYSIDEKECVGVQERNSQNSQLHETTLRIWSPKVPQIFKSRF